MVQWLYKKENNFNFGIIFCTSRPEFLFKYLIFKFKFDVYFLFSHFIDILTQLVDEVGANHLLETSCSLEKRV
ncbi:hypothetical protein L6452_04907 [Arctium lappa]|uniref:Uncharacterized protein n=1 Tax=Arctium lappa TaxID=4217 RepID=A0ACB9EFD0_ARCLA|nr:hypothetical protein L6452_04907 [Arctium lappa]